MRATAPSHSTALASLLIVAAVGLSGVHAKDLMTVASPTLLHEAKQKSEETGQYAVKVASDLHHHSDTTAKVQHASGDGHQADTRSLRLLHHRKTTPVHGRLSDRQRLVGDLHRY